MQQLTRRAAAAAVLSAACGAAAAAGIPVIDSTASANFALQLAQMVRDFSLQEAQLARLVTQYEQQVRQYEAMTGSFGFAEGNFDAGNACIVADEYRSAFDAVKNGGHAAMSSEAEAAFDGNALGEACSRLNSFAISGCLDRQALKAQYLATLAYAGEVAKKAAAEIEADYEALGRAENPKSHDELLAKISLRQNVLELAQVSLSNEIARQRLAIEDAERSAAARASFSAISGDSGEDD